MAEKSVVVDGQEHRLRFTLKALKEIERVGDVQITSPDFAKWGGTLEGIGVLLWAGLLHEGEGLTLDEVEGMIDIEDISTLSTALQEAFMGSMPDPNQLAGTPKAPIRKPRPLRAQSSTGKTSGA